jgi:hypothetical protein
MARLTKRVLDAAEANRAFIWDDEIKGFGLRSSSRP